MGHHRGRDSNGKGVALVQVVQGATVEGFGLVVARPRGQGGDEDLEVLFGRELKDLVRFDLRVGASLKGDHLLADRQMTFAAQHVPELGDRLVTGWNRDLSGGEPAQHLAG